MREIKFRGKFIDGGWIMSDYNTDIDPNPAYSISNFFALVYAGKIDPATVGQWTGLKDCKGVDIYEGDIVEYNIGCSDSDDPSGIIEFQIGRYFIEHDGNLLTIDNTTDIEVIGNIHEVTK